MRRRTLLKGVGILGGGACLGGFAHLTEAGPSPLSRFKVGAISDGFSQDFEEALMAMKAFSLSWVEIRNVWGIYNTEASPAQLQKIKELLEKYEFKVSVIDSALYKCALPGTTPVGHEKDVYPYSGQMDLLKRASERAHLLGTDKIRIFAFWRVADTENHYPRIVEELFKAAEVARGAGMRLVLEDEGACNVGTGLELARMLKLIAAPNLGANWDVGNGNWHGEISFPDGYKALDEKRIWHMHIKGVQCDPGMKHCHETFADEGQIDLAGQFRALDRAGYQETMSLECEFKAPGMTHAATTKRSMEGLLKVLTTALA